MNNEQIYEIPEISDIRLLDIDTDAEWDKLSSQLGFKRKTKILRIDMLIKIAAAVLIVVGLGTLINSSINNSGISTFSAQNAPVETVVEHSTQISLNCNSSITCNSKQKGVFSVDLKGEAYFDVEKNPERTFEINTQDLTVVVHGTSFNICEDNEATIVTVTSGVVEVISKTDGKSVTITKDKQLTYNHNGFDVKTVDNFNNIAWKLKEFNFCNTPLAEIMEQLSKAYGFTYNFENPESKDLRISGSFSNQKLESIINILNQTLDETDIVNNAEGVYTVKTR